MTDYLRVGGQQEHEGEGYRSRRRGWGAGGQRQAGWLMACGWGVRLCAFLRGLLSGLGVSGWFAVVVFEVVLQGSSDCLAGCIPHFVVQVIRQINGYGWHQPDNVT